jgi:transcriptional regulator GlxA family with amidase domain
VQEDRIFVIDGSVWTSAGMTATMDLLLAMVETDVGPELARTVAKKMVIHHRQSLCKSPKRLGPSKRACTRTARQRPPIIFNACC